MDFTILKLEDYFQYICFFKTIQNENKLEFLNIKSKFGQENANKVLKSWIEQIKILISNQNLKLANLYLVGNRGFETDGIWITKTEESFTILTKTFPQSLDVNRSLLELLIIIFKKLVDIEYSYL